VGLQDVAILVLGRGSERCEVGRRWTVAVEREHHLAGRRRPLTRPKRRDRALVVDEGEATLPCSARIPVGNQRGAERRGEHLHARPLGQRIAADEDA